MALKSIFPEGVHEKGYTALHAYTKPGDSYPDEQSAQTKEDPPPSRLKGPIAPQDIATSETPSGGTNWLSFPYKPIMETLLADFSPLAIPCAF
jgi:hypothetical protein